MAPPHQEYSLQIFNLEKDLDDVSKYEFWKYEI